jgi:hypothetical protein
VTDARLAALRWDAEYRKGRYASDPPLSFVTDITHTLDEEPALRDGIGLYIGCGNGRNYLALVDAGLRRLCGLDLSLEALDTILERTARGSATIRCDAGPKQGLAVHFYAADDLSRLTREAFDIVMPPRQDVVHRAPPQTGFWAQWEAIWRRRGPAARLPAM